MNSCPNLLQKHWQILNVNVCFLLSYIQRILLEFIKPIIKSLNFFPESFFFVLFMWKKSDVHFEKVCNLPISFFTLIDIVPNVFNILKQSFWNLLTIISLFVKISQNKAKCSLRVLIEKSQVYLKNCTKKSIVTSMVSADILRPHVDDQYIGHCQCKKRGGLFKRSSLVSTFWAICSFYIEDDDVFVFVYRNPNSFCCLLHSASLLIQYIELCFK